MTLAFRQAQPSDLRFVADAWAKSYCASWALSPLDGYAPFGFLDSSQWGAAAVEAAKRHIARETVRTIVAYEDEPWAARADIYGFLVADTTDPPPLVYYLYTKSAYRRRGFARALFAAAGIDPDAPFRYLAQTRSSEEIAAAGKIPNARFEPTPRMKERRA